jgi:hypothetical protein
MIAAGTDFLTATSPGPKASMRFTQRYPVQLVRIGGQTLALAIALVAWPGCTPGAPDRLVVATSWPVGARERLEMEFRNWVAASHDRFTGGPVRIQWLAVAPGDDPLKLARRARAPQVFLGSEETIAIFANQDQLAPIEHAGGARLCNVTGKEKANAPSHLALAALAVWNDPRGDRASLNRAMGRLAALGWREGYAELVQTAAVRERFGRSSASEAASSSADFVAIARTASGPGPAQEFLRFLCETQGARAGPGPGVSDLGSSASFSTLVADLLGATLVDAQDELWTAWRALGGLSDRERALAWLVEPPPWPPASVSKYLGRDGERAMALIETLSVEVAPDAPARAWLKRSWLSPARLVDRAFLAELSQAAEGQLCREPRFRAWLREEWTAWARQRYRRVARWSKATKGT